MSTNHPRAPRLRGTFGWTAAISAVIPAALGVLWLVGAAVGKVGRVAGRVHVNWTQVTYGTSTVVALTAITAATHAVRTLRYRRAHYQAAVEELS